MLARLGNVIYWAACGLAVLIIGGITYAYFFGDVGTRIPSDALPTVAGALGFAFAIWLIGRACLYVLAGR